MKGGGAGRSGSRSPRAGKITTMASEAPSERPPRLLSLDLLRGIALVFILEAHLGIWWGNSDWFSAWALVQVVIRPFGPANFIFASVIGTLVSLKVRDSGSRATNERFRLWKRFMLYVIIGSFLNVINAWDELIFPGTPIYIRILMVVFRWNIFTYLAFVQVIILHARRLPRLACFTIAAAIFTFYFIAVPVFVRVLDNHLVNYQMQDVYASDVLTGSLVVYFLLFFENSMAPLVPWLALAFIVMGVYKTVVDLLATPGTSREALRAAITRAGRVSIIVLCVAILLGSALSPGLMSQAEYFKLVNDDAFRVWNPAWGGYPLFLHQNNPAYILYSFALISLLFGITTLRVDLQGVKNKVSSIFISFGKYSMTVFLTHALFSFIRVSLSYWWFLVMFTLVTVFYMVVMVTWDTRWRGRYTIEWLVKFYVDANISALVKKHSGKKATERPGPGTTGLI